MTQLHKSQEGLGVTRLLMVLSSISPIFIIWAILGNCLIPEHYFITLCVLLIFVPNFILWWRIRTARKHKDERNLTIGKSEDYRHHLLVYLFAMLLPFYSQEFASWREFVAVFVALTFIVFLFWHLNLHYLNLIFAIQRYRIYTVSPLNSENPYSGRENWVIITKRLHLSSGEQITALRVTDTLYLEVDT